MFVCFALLSIEVRSKNYYYHFLISKVEIKRNIINNQLIILKYIQGLIPRSLQKLPFLIVQPSEMF